MRAARNGALATICFVRRDGLSALFRDAWRRISAYAADPDPRVAACNLIALVVVSNQPFYPLYVRWAVSPDIAPIFLTFLSTPLFAAIPAVARRRSRAGRALLPLIGMGNVLVSAKAFGVQSGVAIFLIPCALIAAAVFRPSERWIALALIGLALAVFVVIGSPLLTPIHLYTAEEYTAFVRLNALSASGLVVFVGFVLSGLLKA